MTNDTGRKYIKSFQIIQHDWHLSHHKPIVLHLRVPLETNLSGLSIREIDLNYLPNDTSHEIVQLRGRYNCVKITDDLVRVKEKLSDAVNRELHSNNIEQALEVLDVCLMHIHKSNKI